MKSTALVGRLLLPVLVWVFLVEEYKLFNLP